jgi:hypothetical protein
MGLGKHSAYRALCSIFARIGAPLLQQQQHHMPSYCIGSVSFQLRDVFVYEPHAVLCDLTVILYCVMD